MKNVLKPSVTNLCVVCTLLRIITINSSYKHVHGLWYNLQENLTIYKVYVQIIQDKILRQNSEEKII